MDATKKLAILQKNLVYQRVLSGTFSEDSNGKELKMPRGDNMPPSLTLAHLLILGEEKAGKTTWLLDAAESGFNVLLLDGDVAQQAIERLSPAAKKRVFYMEVGDKLVGESDARMIRTVADIFTSTTFLWNDRTQDEYSRSKDPHDPESGACLDEIWQLKPGKLDHNWVLGVDSWTTLAYSAKLAKAQDLGVELADVEKLEQNLYAGVGNRLDAILYTQQKAPCHTCIIGHATQYEKTKSPENVRAGEVKPKDRIVEWTKMVPVSGSNPHGFKMGKFFSDIGWIDVDKWGKRVLSFEKTNARTSGGNLHSKGDPKTDHRFENVIRAIGGNVPGANADTPLGDGLTIFPAGTYIPAAKVNPLASKSKTSESKTKPADATAPVSTVKGLGGLAGLKNLGKK